MGCRCRRKGARMRGEESGGVSGRTGGSCVKPGLEPAVELVQEERPAVLVGGAIPRLREQPEGVAW